MISKTQLRKTPKDKLVAMYIDLQTNSVDPATLQLTQNQLAFAQTENDTLKEKIEDILKAIQEAFASTELPSKITFWWVLTNLGTVARLIRVIINIIRRDEPADSK